MMGWCVMCLFCILYTYMVRILSANVYFAFWTRLFAVLNISHVPITSLDLFIIYHFQLANAHIHTRTDVYSILIIFLKLFPHCFAYNFISSLVSPSLFRLYRCSGCDSLFPSLMLLEHHKEEFEHWSDVDDDHIRPPCCRRNRGDDYTDSDSFTSDAESEDLERLL